MGERGEREREWVKEERMGEKEGERKWVKEREREKR